MHFFKTQHSKKIFETFLLFFKKLKANPIKIGIKNILAEITEYTQIVNKGYTFKGFLKLRKLKTFFEQKKNKE